MNSEDMSHTNDLYNMIGAFHSKIDSYFRHNITDDYTTTFVQKSSVKTDLTVGNVRTISWKGMVTPRMVIDKLLILREKVRDKILPWACLSVWGFEDSPVSWNHCEHSFLYSGENDYSFFIFPDDNYLLFITTGKYDDFTF